MIHNKKSFAALPKFSSPYHPTIVGTTSKRYAVLDGRWVRIDETVTFKDVKSLWEPIKLEIQEPVNKYQKNNTTKEWKIPSSKGDKFYHITFKNSTWKCDCPAWGFRRKCRHVEEAKATLK